MLLFGFLFYKDLFWPFVCGEVDHTDSGEPPHTSSENRLVVIPGRGSRGAKRFLNDQSFSLMYAECLYSLCYWDVKLCVLTNNSFV